MADNAKMFGGWSAMFSSSMSVEKGYDEDAVYLAGSLPLSRLPCSEAAVVF
jgi:hypothetical protein